MCVYMHSHTELMRLHFISKLSSLSIEAFRFHHESSSLSSRYYVPSVTVQLSLKLSFETYFNKKKKKISFSDFQYQ